MLRYLLALVTALLCPALASAHEVYVLSPEQVTLALGIQPFNMLAVIQQNLGEFLFWAFIAALTVFIVFFVSLIRPLERWLDPMLRRGRRYAAPVARITLGLSFLAAAYYQAIFGPELPLVTVFGSYAGLATVALIVIGTLLIIGMFTRAATLGALVLFAILLAEKGIYMLTYANYLGELLVLLILGAHATTSVPQTNTSALTKRLAPYSFTFLRVLFGTALLYASLYAKILHNQLALMVAELPLNHPHSLAYVFGFEPRFLVLGAAIIEIVIALFFIVGFEIRFTALFLLFWLSLSLWYFGEVVWPHIILIGIPIALILYGYDRYSLEGHFFKRDGREPIF
ncbi:MAG: hypothetical protein ACYC75_01190 [Minisyncoccota bacterium]